MEAMRIKVGVSEKDWAEIGKAFTDQPKINVDGMDVFVCSTTPQGKWPTVHEAVVSAMAQPMKDATEIARAAAEETKRKRELAVEERKKSGRPKLTDGNNTKTGMVLTGPRCLGHLKDVDDGDAAAEAEVQDKREVALSKASEKEMSALRVARTKVAANAKLNMPDQVAVITAYSTHILKSSKTVMASTRKQMGNAAGASALYVSTLASLVGGSWPWAQMGWTEVSSAAAAAPVLAIATDNAENDADD